MKTGKIHQLIVFLLVIIGFSLIYDYPATLLKRPQSTHNWRQCDGASLALNYYQEGMHFFKPQTHGLYSDNYTNGYTAPSEIPILYYFVAILYNLFGYHEFIFRALNLLIFYLGLFYLFKLALTVLNSLFFSIIIVAFIFSSPLLVYYANNFMPNTVALSFSLMGWYYFYRYYLSKRTSTFLLSMLFFSLAGSIKITELSGPLIILILMTADKLKIINLQLNSRHDFFLKITSLLLIFIIVTSWIIFAKSYNNMHGSTQFSTYTFPFWNMHNDDIAFIFHKMHVLWLKDYFYPLTLFFLLACVPFIAFFMKRSDKILSLSSIFLIFGLIAFSLLWFQALGDHDYFFVGFYVLPAFLFINFFLILKSFKIKIIYQRIIQIGFILFVLINVYHARKSHHIRYNSWMNDYKEMKDVYTIKPWLQKIGIHDRDTVVFYPSYNIRPLYLMNLKGWSIIDFKAGRPAKQIRDSLLMKTYIAKGAKYLITNNIKSIMSCNSLLPYITDLYSQYGSVFIFRLPPLQDNAIPADKLSF